MNYKLAKQLKEAGFPQDKWYPQDSFEDAKNPTLSELIEACGEGFFELRKDSERWSCGGRVEGINFYGKTPEESVAKLWLKLNK
ncbi:MAG: hypothetical protein ACTSQE_06935 [Candidatus Heimdallarchaeaceae archaeon]